MRPLRKLYGPTAAAEFGPLKLIAVRDAMIALGWTRVSINKQIGRIRQFFRWAVSRELVPSNIYQALMSVRGLASADLLPRIPSPSARAQATLDATLPQMSRHVKAMVQLQLYTGARPGEITTMKMADLEMSGKVWKYRPAQHKTRHHGHVRVILLGPQAQAVLKDFLRTDTTSYLFSPADATAERRAKAAAARKTPLSCGNRAGTNRKAKPKKIPGEYYSTMATTKPLLKRAKRPAFLIGMFTNCAITPPRSYGSNSALRLQKLFLATPRCPPRCCMPRIHCEKPRASC